MKKLMIVIVSVIVMTGCLSVGRLPFPTNEMYSDDGCCTNREWAVFFDEQCFREKSWTTYPSIYLRCVATGYVFSPIDYTKTGRELYNERHKYWASIPLTILWITSPVDAIVDTLYLPWDLLKD